MDSSAWIPCFQSSACLITRAGKLEVLRLVVVPPSQEHLLHSRLRLPSSRDQQVDWHRLISVQQMYLW